MRRYFHAFCMCRSMFCAIPCLWSKIWDEKARDRILVFLPLIGLEIGAIWAALGWACRYLKLPDMVTGLVLCAYPLLATGFLHLDGYMDVTDAVRSYRSLDERRQILKDSRVGAFAVIGVVLLVLAQFAFCVSLDKGMSLWVLMLIPVVSRCCSALAVMTLPPMNTSQYAGRRKNKGHIAVTMVCLAAALVAGVLLGGGQGLALAGCLASYGAALAKGCKSLEGMNGDIAGYALSLSEMTALGVLALYPLLERALASMLGPTLAPVQMVIHTLMQEGLWNL